MNTRMRIGSAVIRDVLSGRVSDICAVLCSATHKRTKSSYAENGMFSGQNSVSKARAMRCLDSAGADDGVRPALRIASACGPPIRLRALRRPDRRTPRPDADAPAAHDRAQDQAASHGGAAL